MNFLCDVLQGLSKYHNDKLLHESLHLLGRIYTAEEELFEKATQAQVDNFYNLVSYDYYFGIYSVVTGYS